MTITIPQTAIHVLVILLSIAFGLVVGFLLGLFPLKQKRYEQCPHCNGYGFIHTEEEQ